MSFLFLDVAIQEDSLNGLSSNEQKVILLILFFSTLLLVTGAIYSIRRINKNIKRSQDDT